MRNAERWHLAMGFMPQRLKALAALVQLILLAQAFPPFRGAEEENACQI